MATPFLIVVLHSTIIPFSCKTKPESPVLDSIPQNNHLDQFLKEEVRKFDSVFSAKKPGYYYVSEKEIRGIPVYAANNKLRLQNFRISSMQKVYIVKIEDSLGFYEMYMDEQYRLKPKGWVNMKHLEPEDDFVFSTAKYFRVKSSNTAVPVYADYKKTKTLPVRIQGMEQLRVYKIVGKMAYFKDFIHPTYLFVSGWIELDKLEEDK